MSKLIKRRDFLKGATGVAVGAVVPVSAVAQALGSGGPSIVPTLSFWDGNRFVSPVNLPSGDASLSSVRVTIQGYGLQGRLLGMDQIVAAIGTKGIVELPFRAWSAPPAGCPVVRFEANATRGLKFRLRLVDGTSDLSLSVGSERKAKLREGVYVISFKSAAGFTYQADQASNPVFNGVEPLGPGYVVITIERA